MESHGGQRCGERGTVRFHPVIGRWFAERFGEPTDVQLRAWAAAASGEHVLIAAPTGSGKTLAALMPCLDKLVRAKLADPGAGPRTRVIYVTPLKALNNDIHHHLFRFAQEMEQAARREGDDWPGIRIAVRTGDTSQSTRASMLREPPDLLVTTPESLYLLLTSVKGREMLRHAEQVVVDEIHDLAADKRGAHLSLTLERLVEWSGRTAQRIGVSATQKPLERVARFLAGWEESTAGASGRTANETASGTGKMRGCDGLSPRPVRIVESRMDKRFEVTVTVPKHGKPAKDKEAVWRPIVERLLELMEGSRSVLVFVNNRRLCERLTLHLNDHVGYEMARSHHGSVSREKRLEVERLLKSGDLRCLVATSSLELGIDVGHVDLVVQIDSPKSAAAGIQRIGRAGHAAGATSRGVILARSRGELAEAAVLARAVAARDIEEIRVPRHRLDVLAQQTVAAVAADDWEPGRLLRAFTRSDCYRCFPRERFEAMLDVLSGYYPFARPLIGWERAAGRLHRLPATSLAAVTGAGTIPQSSAYPVHHAETRLHIGELDEEFVHESRVGDVFQLGTSSWMIRSIRHDRVYVSESANSYSVIPFWRADAVGRSRELGAQVGRLLERLAESARCAAPREETIAMLQAEYLLDEEAAAGLLRLVESQEASCGVPGPGRIVAEHYRDDAKQHHLVIHSLFGKRVNRTWELALSARFAERLRVRVYSFVRDNGIEFIFSEWDSGCFDDIRSVSAESLERLLTGAVAGSPLFARTFRQIAETALLLSRGFSRVPAWKMRLRSEELLKEALPYADRFPFLREAMVACLEETLDVPGLAAVLEGIESGEIRLVCRDTFAPSPFAAQFIGDYVMQVMYESDAFSRDVQARLLEISRDLAEDWFGPEGLRSFFEPRLLREAERRLAAGGGSFAAPDDPDSLHRLLKLRGDLTEREIAAAAGDAAVAWLQALASEGRAARVRVGGEDRWIAADELHTYAAFPADPAAVLFILKRFIDHRLSFTPADLEARYGLAPERARGLTEEWLAAGLAEPVPFAAPGETGLYISAAAAERLIRFALGDFRARQKPLEASRYAAGLAWRQHLHPVARLSGPQGLQAVIAELQGLMLPVSLWENEVFPSRLTDYRKQELDRLCAAGELFWIGRKEADEKEGKVAFFLAGDKTLYAPYLPGGANEETRHPELLSLLKRRGASFLSALSREAGVPPSELLQQLFDLVWEGRVSNDQFAPLRLHSASAAKRKAKEEFQSGLGRWYALEERGAAAFDAEASALALCRHLLRLYGVLARSVVSLGVPYRWEQLSDVLERLEEWGLATRGFFIGDAPFLQFTTPEEAERLRRPKPEEAASLVPVSAADPANPYGMLVPWPDVPGARFSRKPGNYLVFRGDRWVLWVEQYGKSVVSLDPSFRAAPGKPLEARLAEELRDLFRILLSRSGSRKIVVGKWDGAVAGEGPVSLMLTNIGAERDRSSCVFWPSSFR